MLAVQVLVLMDTLFSPPSLPFRDCVINIVGLKSAAVWREDANQTYLCMLFRWFDRQPGGIG